MNTLEGRKKVSNLTDEEKIDKWLNEHDGEDYCNYCYCEDECPHGVTCHGGEPIFPICADISDITEILDTDAILEEMRGWA
jgi:hypothetical protein